MHLPGLSPHEAEKRFVFFIFVFIFFLKSVLDLHTPWQKKIKQKLQTKSKPHIKITH